MKAISKKLLSLLVVIAMVLSMVPFGGLSIFAVETKAAALTEDEQTAAATAISNAAAVIEAANALDPTTATSCPVCGEGVTWTAVSEAGTLEPGHYYLSGDISSSGVALFNGAAANESVCLHLNGHNVTSTASKAIQGASAGTMNIFGQDASVVSGAYGYSGNGIYWAAGVLNIYGGTFQKDTTKGASIVALVGGEINQYGGIIDGTSDTPAWVCGGVYITNGTYNMYGGTIQNGSGTTAGGNVNIYATKPNTSAEFNMYSGTVKDGTTTGGTSTSAQGGGNFYLYKNGTSNNSTADDTSDDGPYTNALNLYGGTVSGGVSEGTKGCGGNIFAYGVVNVGDGAATETEITISGGSATYMGGSIYLATGGATLNVDDGALLSGSATSQASYGGIVGSSGAVIINIDGGKITDGTAGRGGNIDLSGAGKLTITDGEVSNGESTGNGGNIFAQDASAEIKISGGEVKDGIVSKYGGNIHLTKGLLEISGTAKLTGGTANQGGNIYVGGTYNATTHEVTDKGTLKINGGTITGGEATYGDAIRMGEASEVIMTGGTVNGQIQPANNCCTYGNGTITVSGAAKITGHGLDCGADGIILTDAGLTEGASIAVYQIGRPFVQYADAATATAAKGYYTGSQYGYGPVVNTDGTLEIAEVGVYCEYCKQTITDWQERTASTAQDGQGHWYLGDDVTTDKDQTVYVNNTGTKIGCLDLNGHTLTMTGRIGLTVTGTTLNIMDSAGGGEVITSASRETAAYNYAIRIQSTNNTINLYGGTYKNTNGTTAVISVAGAGNVLNIYEGAVIDGANTTRGVDISAGTANLKGGTIKDGYTTHGGNVRVSATGSSFVMESGTISGGIATTAGGNIYAGSGTTLTIKDGTISGGKVQSAEDTYSNFGGNIGAWNAAVNIEGGLIYGGTTSGVKHEYSCNIACLSDEDGRATEGMGVLTISGGTILGDVATSDAAGLTILSGAPSIVTSMEIGGTTYTAVYGGLVLTGDRTADISGLAVVDDKAPEIWVSASKDTVISETYTGAEALADYFHCTNSDYEVAVNSSNQLYIAEVGVEAPKPEVDVFAPWDFDGKAYCPVCYANGDTEVKTWVALNSDGTADNLTAASTTVKAKRVGTVSDGNHYHVYFEDDHTYNGNWGALTNKSTLCLHTNGKTVGYQGRLFVSGSTLNIMGDGTITSDGASSWGDATLTVAGGTLNLYGGTIKSTSTDGTPVLVLRNTAKVTMEDGVVLDGTGVARCVKFECSATSKATFTMNGGTIQNGYYVVGKDGREAGSTATMLAAGSRNGGGNVWVEYGTFTMNGGEIINGIAGYSEITDDAGETTTYSSYGGNFYLASGGELEINNDAVISGGRAASSWTGGNIYMTTASAKVTMNGGEIKGGYQIDTDNTTKKTTNGQGGNIFANGGTITLNGGTVSNSKDDNKVSYAANIRLNGTSNAVSLVINGGKITGGYASYGAGVYMEGDKASLTLTKGTISEGVATTCGGNLYVKGGTVALNGGEIKDGNAVTGGNVYLSSDATSFTQASGNTITGGKGLVEGSSCKGGNLYIAASATLNGTVSYGNTNYAGGNAHVSGSSTVLTINGQFLGLKEGSTVLYGGNIATEGTCTVTVYGTVADGHATSRGGNIDIMGAGKLNIESGGTIKDGVSYKDGASVGTGCVGNIFAQNAAAVININGDITGGQGVNAGNLYVKSATVNMNGGTISGGSNSGSPNADNVYLHSGNATMNMNGGTVYGTDGATSPGSAIRVSTAELNLGGDAKVIRNDGICKNVIQCEPAGLVQIDNAWSGTAVVSFNSSYNYGDVIDPAESDNSSREYYAVCGSFDEEGNFTRGGSFENGHLIYSGLENPEIVGIEGLCYIAGYGVVAADGSSKWYTTSADAISAIDDGAYLLAGANVEVGEGVTVYIDPMKAIEVTGSGTVYGIEPANADFVTASTGTITAGDTTVNLESDSTFNGVRYLKIADGSYHAIEMGVTGVSLRPTAVGLYYKATYKCDADLAAAITAYGVVLSVNDMPGDDFADVATDQFTVREDFSTLYAATTVANTVTANSGSVFGIMKESKDVADNAAHGVMKIYANAYILVNGEAIYVADTENCGKEAGVALSLYDVMAMVDQKWDTLNLSETQIGQINDLFDKCKAWGGVDWTFTNITGTTV